MPGTRSVANGVVPCGLAEEAKVLVGGARSRAERYSPRSGQFLASLRAGCCSLHLGHEPLDFGALGIVLAVEDDRVVNCATNRDHYLVAIRGDVRYESDVDAV